MKRRKFGAIVFGVLTLGAIATSIFRMIDGRDVGFNEIVMIAMFTMLFLSALTWGGKDEKDGIYIDDELGRKITEKAAKMSYHLLVVIILFAVAIEKLVYGTVNIFLLLVLGIGMILLPAVEFVVARKYQ